jgi:hypothetical protein
MVSAVPEDIEKVARRIAKWLVIQSSDNVALARQIRDGAWLDTTVDDEGGVPTVRAAARRAQPLGGADAQALEHALTQTEAELATERSMVDHFDRRVAELEAAARLRDARVARAIVALDAAPRDVSAQSAAIVQALRALR